MVQHDDHTTAAVQRLQEKWAEGDQRELDEALKAMLTHKATRRYLYWLLELTRAIGVNAMSDNALRTAFNCGEQNIGQQIMAHLVECAPEGFLALLKEKADERIGRDQVIRDTRNGTDKSNRNAFYKPVPGSEDAV